MNQQMMFFNDMETENISKRVGVLHEQLNNLRRGTFGRIDKIINELALIQENIADIQDKLGIRPSSDKIVELSLEAGNE